MATVTGDIGYDYSGLSNIDPYVNADFTDVLNDVKVVSGSVRSGGGLAFTRYTAALPSSDIITSKIEGTGSSLDYNDNISACVLDASANGYGFETNGAIGRIIKITAGVRATLGADFGGLSYASLASRSIEIDVTTGDIKGFIDGVLKVTRNDTSFNTGLQAGFGINWDNSNVHGVVSFAADGYAAAGDTVTPTDPIKIGANTHTTTITPTSGKIISGASEVALTAVSATEATVPAPVDLGAAVLFGEVTYSLTDGVDTVTATTNLVPAAGMNVVTVTPGYDTGPTSWLKDFPSSPVVGSQLLYPDGINCYGDGSWDGIAGTYNCFYINADGTQQQYEDMTITLGEGSGSGTLEGNKLNIGLTIGL